MASLAMVVRVTTAGHATQFRIRKNEVGSLQILFSKRRGAGLAFVMAALTSTFASGARAGDFGIDWSTFDWPAGSGGPLVRVLRDQYGFEIDTTVEITGPFSAYSDGAGNMLSSPDDVILFGGGVESLVITGDAPANAGRRGDNRITATVSASSGGVAFPVDSLRVDILDIDPVDNNDVGDRCDFVTAFGDNGNPTLTPLGLTPTVLVGPGLGSGDTGLLAANEVQCLFLDGPVVSPTSNNDTNGSVRLTYPDNTSRIEVWYDESIAEVRSYYNPITLPYDPITRGIGIFADVAFSTDQTISLTRNTAPATVREGEVISFTYTITNAGELPFNPNQDLVIQDSLVGTVTCPMIAAPVISGGTVTCTTSYTITGGDVQSGVVDSSAVAGIAAIGTPFGSRLRSNTEIASMVVYEPSPRVVARDDDYAVPALNTLQRRTAGEVLSNDTINLLPATFLTATLTVLTEATPQSVGDPVPVLETGGLVAGRVSVQPGVPTGTYEIEYELCDRFDSQQCDRAIVRTVVFDGLGADFGDAPVTYQSASHGVSATPQVYLGSVPPDIESVAQSGITATSDDLLGTDDEDAVIFPVIAVGMTTTLNVPVTGDGYLQAWIDFNGDGLFGGALGENIATDLRDDGTNFDDVAGDGVIQIDVSVPSDATTAATFARFRYASEAGLPVAGFTNDGEVEDYALVIAAVDLVDRGDAPASYGDPRHIVVPLIYLGANLPDTDVTPQHSPLADADDLVDFDDEDAITAIPTLTAGTTVPLTIQTHETLSLQLALGLPILEGITYMQVFIDWNQNGVFDPEDHVGQDLRDGGPQDADGVFNNQISLNITVPTTVSSGFTYARVRWSTTSGIIGDPFDGLSLDGEVEDYRVLLSDGTNDPVPFSCDGTLYRVAGSPSTLQRLVFTEQSSGAYSIDVSTVGAPAAALFNAGWGYNAQDGLLYGVRLGTRDLARIDALGNFDVIAQIPATAATGFVAGDIMDNGVMVQWTDGNVFQLLDLSDPLNPVDLGQITVPQAPLIADIAFNPNDGMVYGVNGDTDRLFYFDPLGGSAGTSSIVEFGPATWTGDYEAVWFDAFGRMYINDNQTNTVYEADVGIQGSGTGSGTLISTLSTGSQNFNDAAGCPSTLGPLPPQGSIQGVVFSDLDVSASPDVGEPGIAAITVSAYNTNGTPSDVSDDTLVATTETDAQGVYRFEDMFASVLYRIEVDEADPDLPPGAVITTENPYTGVRVTAGSQSSGYDFGFASAADLSLTKAAFDTTGVPIASAGADTQIDFVLSVTNDGPALASGVQVRDLIPGGFSYVSDTAAAQGDSYDAGTGVWVVGDVAPGTTESLTLRVTMNPAGDHTNSAEIIASNLPDPDSDPATGALTDDLGDGIADDDEANSTVVFDGTGATLSGVVFLDIGVGAAGMAYDGVQDTDEPGIGSAKIEIFDSTGTLVGSPVVAADGSWTLTLPEGYVDRVTVTVTPDAGFAVVSEEPLSPPGLSNPDPLDGSYSFQPAPGADYTDLRFGLLQEARLSNDQQAAIPAGQVIPLRHDYIADAEGTVQFSTALIQETAPGLFAVSLFYDTACDGTPTTAVDGPVAVSADTRICLIARVTASAAAAPGASISFEVLADTTYGTSGLTEQDRNTDVVRVESAGGRLELRKTVQNLTQGTPEGVSNGATLGDVLEYRIYLENPGNQPATQVVIHDRTPPYTELASPIPSPVNVGSNLVCTVVEPASNVAGYSGSLRWDCTGTHPPGAIGFVDFQVTISP